MKRPALPRGAPIAKPSGTAPKQPDLALRYPPRSPVAIPPRASARGILAEAREVHPASDVFFGILPRTEREDYSQERQEVPPERAGTSLPAKTIRGSASKPALKMLTLFNNQLVISASFGCVKNPNVRAVEQ
jgi:hypothetical protein